MLLHTCFLSSSFVKMDNRPIVHIYITVEGLLICILSGEAELFPIWLWFLIQEFGSFKEMLVPKGIFEPSLSEYMHNIIWFIFGVKILRVHVQRLQS